MSRATLFSVTSIAAIVFIALALFAGPVVFAQIDKPSQESIDAALQDLSAIYGSSVVRIDQAKAICDQEQYMIECAEIGKRHGLFGKEREREVDTILSELKGRVVEELKHCSSTECLIAVATKIATDLSRSNPTLARTVDLTLQDVREKGSIIEASKSVGVDFDECRAMDPDTASVDFLRACAKLAKHEQIRKHIPEEYREHADKTEETAELKEALESGEIACGDGTLEGCGTFCLNPTDSQREEGLAAIPSICRDIAERFFGPEGVAELERTYSAVRQTYEDVRNMYREGRDLPPEFTDENFEEDDIPPYLRARPLPGVICPAVENTPCPPGHYRQGSVNELGCYVRSACIPFNTETQPEQREKDKHVICPAMPTVDSCVPDEDKVVTFTSPDCGTYYACKPKQKDGVTKKFPYEFGSGRLVLSFDEARIYCYESGSKGATARGDKDECLRAFGISVPDIPPEKQCAEYGKGWHTMDKSGNCFNEQMTEYRTGGGALRQCTDEPVYGCMRMGDDILKPTGQVEQIWNSYGLRSWIRTDAEPSRIEELQAACATVPAGSNVWLPGSGTYSSTDFGMPDPEKCKKAAACTSSQYFNGSECVKSEWPQCGPNYFWNGRSCEPTFMSTTTSGGACYRYGSDEAACRAASCSWYQNHYDGSHCDDVAHGNADKGHACSAGQYWDGTTCRSNDKTVSGSCSSEIKNLLGTGCHSMGNAWFNGAMTQYILPDSTIIKSCSAEKISGCSGTHTSVSCPSGQFWSGSSCVSSEGTICGSGEYWDAGKGACTSASRACAQAGGSWDSERYYCVMPGAKGEQSSQQNTPVTTTVTPPSGQKAQIWNSYGLQSWIRDDADPVRIASLKDACANVKSSSANIWMSGAGTYSSVDFGMPDPTKCAKAAECTSSQYFDGSSCVSGSGSGGGSAGSCGSYTSYSSCTSAAGCLWGGSTASGYCYSSSGGGSGGGCGMYTSESSCNAMSACQWQYNACSYKSSGSGGSGALGSCPTNQYWDTQTNSCRSNESACAEAGGTWSSSSNYCVMPGSSSGGGSSCFSGQYWDGSQCVTSPSPTPSPTPSPEPSPSPSPSPTSSLSGTPLAYLCPAEHDWNGSFCTLQQGSKVPSFVASVISAFLSLLGR